VVIVLKARRFDELHKLSESKLPQRWDEVIEGNGRVFAYAVAALVIFISRAEKLYTYLYLDSVLGGTGVVLGLVCVVPPHLPY